MELEGFRDDILLEYVQQNPKSTNTQLFSFLALLNEYIPESYLLMSECKQILGPPDPIHGGPPFEERMEPFTSCIKKSSQKCMIHPLAADISVQVLDALGISRSATVKKLMFSLCGDQAQPHTLQFVKDLLTTRESGVKGREKFSRLIEDIQEKENFYNAMSVLKTASNKLRRNHIYPQTLSRLYYIRGDYNKGHYNKAEEWAKTAIERAPNNSYVADTLGQVYKNRLKRGARRLEGILRMANTAFRAFKEVERKADKEEGPEMNDMAGTVSMSNSFNDRGLFGFIQVAKIAFEKLRAPPSRFIQNLKMEVTAKFDFFERYLTYSKPNMTYTEPHFFWKEIALCYEMYTTEAAAESKSFPGLLDGLNHGLFTSKGRRAGFEEAEQTVSDLEEIQEDLKTTYEANPANVKAVESYILSNILLSNKMHNSPKLTPVSELKAIIHRFLDTDVGCRSPEFYLMALLLFWPEEEPQVVQDEYDEEVEQPATEDEGSEEESWEVEESNEEQEPSREPEQHDLMFEPQVVQDEDDEEVEQPATEDVGSEEETCEVEESNEEQEPSREPEQHDLMFEPQVVQDEDDEEVEQPATDDEGSEEESWEVEESNEEQEPSREPEQHDLMFEPQVLQDDDDEEVEQPATEDVGSEEETCEVEESNEEQEPSSEPEQHDLMFEPQVVQDEDDEEVEQPATEDVGSEEETCEVEESNEEQEPSREPEQHDLMFEPQVLQDEDDEEVEQPATEDVGSEEETCEVEESNEEQEPSREPEQHDLMFEPQVVQDEDDEEVEQPATEDVGSEEETCEVEESNEEQEPSREPEQHDLMFEPQVVQDEDDEEVEQPATEDVGSEEETCEVEESNEEQEPSREPEQHDLMFEPQVVQDEDDEEVEQPATEDVGSEEESWEVEESNEEQEPSREPEQHDLMFEPQVVQDEDDEEVEQPATFDEGSEEESWEVEESNEEQEPSREPEQHDLMFEPDLQQYVTFMEKAFGNSDAKYLRGRYLVPLFFLGKGSGLSRWIHKSRLDAIVENEVDSELAGEQDKSDEEKLRRINEKWIKGDVWQIPEVEDMLLPVRVELRDTPTIPQEFVCAGGKEIKVKVVEPYSVLSPMLVYLGFTIQGPVVF